MYYVKMMDEKHDGFEIIEVETLNYVKFTRITVDDFELDDRGVGAPLVTLFLNFDGTDAVVFYPLGNTYVLNEKGQTIALFPLSAK